MDGVFHGLDPGYIRLDKEGLTPVRFDSSCDRLSLLLKPLSWEKCMAKDGEGALLVQPLTMSRHGLSGAVSYTKWPTR